MIVVWGPLLRRLLRVAVPLGVRYVRSRRRAGRAGSGSRGAVTVIDVQPVGPLDRFDDAARRAVARAAEVQGGPDLTVEALLLGVLETHAPSADALRAAGADPDVVTDRLRDAVTAPAPGGTTAAARAALRAAERSADRRGAFSVEPTDLVAAVTGDAQQLGRVLDPASLAALRRVVGHL
jgi:hypothetical protein